MSLFLWSLFSPPVDTHLCRKYRRIGLKTSRRLVLIHRRRKKKVCLFFCLIFFLQPKLLNPTLCITSLNSALTHRWIFCHLFDPNCSLFFFFHVLNLMGGVSVLSVRLISTLKKDAAVNKTHKHQDILLLSSNRAIFHFPPTIQTLSKKKKKPYSRPFCMAILFG